VSCWLLIVCGRDVGWAKGGELVWLASVRFWSHCAARSANLLVTKSIAQSLGNNDQLNFAYIHRLHNSFGTVSNVDT
jgi:hypothetical protein